MTKEEKLARKQQRKAEKVGLGKLLLWNSSSCSVALSTLLLGYATFYCTDVLQLAPALVGTLFMGSKIFDSFTDVVAGFIVARTQTRWGKGRPYEIFMLFLWLSTWLLFSCPTSFATATKCVWIFCMYTFMNSICVTFLNAMVGTWCAPSKTRNSSLKSLVTAVFLRWPVQWYLMSCSPRQWQKSEPMPSAGAVWSV